MMLLLDRYIRNTVISSTAMVGAVILGLQCFLALVQQFHYVGLHQYGLSRVFLYVAMQMPAQFYQLFPMAGFLGALIGLGRLSSSSQLLVMQSAGVSVVRIAWSVAKAAILMIIVLTIIGESVGPLLQQHADKMRHDALVPQHNTTLLRSVWLHQNHDFTHIATVKNKETIFGVTRYRFNAAGRLMSMMTAASGHLKNNHWQLQKVKKIQFQPHHIHVMHYPRLNIRMRFKPVLQAQITMVSVRQTLVDLYHTIHYRRAMGLCASRFVFNFWQRIFQPLATLVMIGLAVPFVFGSFRSSSASVRILIGVTIGFVFYMLNQLFGPISLVYQFPPILAAILPTALFLFIMALLFRKT